MSKGLEALEKIKNNDFPLIIATLPPIPATLEGQTKDELFDIIERELEALELLKLFDFKFENYNEELFGSVSVKSKKIILDDEEIDLLREVLK